MSDLREFTYIFRVLNRFFEQEKLPYKAKLILASHVEQNNSNLFQIAELRQEINEKLVELIMSDEPYDYGVAIYKILDPLDP